MVNRTQRKCLSRRLDMDFESEYLQGRYVGRGCAMRLGAPTLAKRAFSTLVACFASIALATIVDLTYAAPIV